MKVTVEVECTPEEAREFLGLPDLRPMQAAVMAKIEKGVADAAEALAPDALLRSWLSLVPGGPDGMRDLFSRFLGGRPGGTA
jgi:hypothetical protein